MAREVVPFDGRLLGAIPSGLAAETTHNLEQRRQRLAARRDVLVEQYGSVDAALAPCEREKLLLSAAGRWRRVQPGGRWTETLAGFGSVWDWRRIPKAVLQALAEAYPMPVTYAEAKAEAGYWDERNSDLEAVGRYGGDFALDLVCIVRWWLVRELVEHALHLTSVADIADRAEMAFADEGGTSLEMERAIVRDLKALAGVRFVKAWEGVPYYVQVQRPLTGRFHVHEVLLGREVYVSGDGPVDDVPLVVRGPH